MTASAVEVSPPRAAYLVHGEDAGLVSQAVSSLVEALKEACGAGSVPLEEYGEVGRSEPGQGEPFTLGPVLDACRTPPFLSERRIVVVRDVSALDAEQLREVTAYLADPVETTVLVLVSPGHRAPAALAKAVAAAGVVVDPAPGGGARGRSAWFAERLRRSGVNPDVGAARMIEEHLGEDLARLDGLLATLESAYGEGAAVNSADLVPFLGTAGGVAPWDLSDAIDAGEREKALRALSRMLGAGGRSPFQVLALLHRHYRAMLRLDGSGVVDEQQAAQATGLSPYPARKALDGSRRLGHSKLSRAITLLAGADAELRGEQGWPDEAVMEVLVARLAGLAERRQRTAPRRQSGRR